MSIEIRMTNRESYESIEQVKVDYNDSEIVEIVNRYFDSRRAQQKARRKRMEEIKQLKAAARTHGWKV